MIVTNLVETAKGKLKVYIDYEFAFVLYKGELRTYQIKKDAELTQENYEIILNEVLPKRAKLRCMNLLKSRDYTRHQLTEKLIQGMYPQEVIEAAIEFCEAYHYLDDARYARAYIDYAQNTKSRRQIEQDLQKKGVSKEDIEEAFTEKEEADELQQEEFLIRKLLEKKHYDKMTASYEEKQKIVSFLYRKGFSLEKIYKELDADYNS